MSLYLKDPLGLAQTIPILAFSDLSVFFLGKFQPPKQL